MQRSHSRLVAGDAGAGVDALAGSERLLDLRASASTRIVDRFSL